MSIATTTTMFQNRSRQPYSSILNNQSRTPLGHRRLKRGGFTFVFGQTPLRVCVITFMGSIILSFNNDFFSLVGSANGPILSSALLPQAMAFNLWHNIEKLEKQATTIGSNRKTSTTTIIPPITGRKDQDLPITNFDLTPPDHTKEEEENEEFLENSSSIKNKNNIALSKPSTASFMSFLSSLHNKPNMKERSDHEQKLELSTDVDINSEANVNDQMVVLKSEAEDQALIHQLSSNTDEDDENKSQDDNLVVASFVARKKACTKPLPFCSSGSNASAFTTVSNSRHKQKISETLLEPATLFVKDFFLKHRNLLFATGATIREINEPTKFQWNVFNEEQEQHKKRRYDEHRYEMDQESSAEEVITQFLELSNPPMGFLGLQLISKVTVATQLFCFVKEQKNQDDTIRLPEYQFTLVDSSFDAHGPKALVWVFNKIMKRGNNNRKDNNGSSHKEEDADENTTTTLSKLKKTKKKTMKTSGFTRVWAEEIPLFDSKDGTNNDPKMIRFCTDATIVSNLVFPKLFIRILPVSLEKMEEEGSKAMQGAVEKDIEPAMERIQNAWYNCTEENVSQT